MNYSILRAKASLLLMGCTLVAGCSLQVPSESDVFEKNSAGGQSSGGSASIAGNSAQIGGLTSTDPGTSSGGEGGTIADESGGAISTEPNAGASSVAGGATDGGSTGAGGSGVIGGSTVGPTGGTKAVVGGGTATGGAITVGGATSATGGSVTVGGSGVIVTGGAPATGGAATTAATVTGGAVATGGAATGGAATGGAATGGSPTGGAPPQVLLQYKFDEGSGTAAVDSTANHFDGTLSNVTWSPTGRNSAGVNFGNAASQIQVPSNLLGTSHSLTVSAWVNLTANTAENRLFYFGTADSTSYFTLTFNNSATPAGISVRFKSPAGTEQILTTPTQIPTTIWKHITVSISNVGAALYIDGKIVAQDRTLVMDPTTLGAPMTNWVGASPTAGQNFQGEIDEFYVYNGMLPVSDIRVLAAPKADYSMYHFDEGTGTATADSSTRGSGGTGINGTLMGGATWVPSPFGTGVLLANTSAPPAQQYVDLGDGIISDCGLHLTLAAWVKFTTNATEAPLLEFAKDTANLINITTYTAGTYNQPIFSFELANNTTTNPRIVRIRPYAGWVIQKWTHIAVVRSDISSTDLGKAIGLYQDGVKVGTSNLGTGAQVNTWGATTLNSLGKSTNDAIPGFDGAVDEVLVSCRAYTDDEIAHLAYLPPN